MARVLGDVVEGLVRIEQQILAPLVRRAVDHDLADLESNHLEHHVLQRAAGAERDQRLVADSIFELLQDRDAGVSGVEQRVAALADDVDGVAEEADGRRRPARGAADRSHGDRYHPSNFLTFRRRSASKSTLCPMYSAGASSL